ncbi:hypothetical protein [Halosimplex halobium]|uniref:hypothetical protein n=1 Tax=Halosimplex halobium TaxID=3396618 RepID=UPI003F5503CD
MRQTVATVGVVTLLLLAGCGSLLGGQGTGAPTETDVSTDEPTDTPTATASATPTATSSPTAPTATDSPTATPTEGPTTTATPSPTPTPAPTATPTATPTPTPDDGDEPNVEVRGGDLSVDADAVYADVQALLGTDVEPPTVYVREEMPALERYNRQLAENQFYDTFGYGDRFINTSVYHGSATPQRIVVMPKDANATQQKTLLAHEYVHWLQFHSDAVDTGNFGGFVDDTDSQQVAAGLVEGAAVYVTDQYVERYLNTSWNQTQELRNQYEHGAEGRRLFRARYLYGARYIHSQVDSPRNVSWLYDPSTPTPVTGEQLIHGDTPSEEPERNLTLSVNRTGEWRFPYDHYDTKGEIVVRTMLRADLNRSTAATAAAGWGTDSIARLHDADNSSRTAFAWALRWDDPGEADEFAAAFESWRAAQPTGDGTVYRLARVGDGTTVVFAGPESFVGNATASGTAGNVTVSVAG